VKYAERFDYDKACGRCCSSRCEFEPESDGTEALDDCRSLTASSTRRELEALLHYNGFAIERWIGDFKGEPTHETHHLALIARPHAKRGARLRTAAP
jgi:hypothetical protein